MRKNRFTNDYTWRSREDLNIDTRTATEYGVVRTFFDATFTWTSGGYTGTALTAAPSAGSGRLATASPVATLGVYYAFIQFAGFTMGKAISQFSAPWSNYPGNNFDGLVGGGGTVTGVNQFTYTAEFGNGVSAAISAQDPTAYYQAGVNNVAVYAGVGGYSARSNYGGTTVPGHRRYAARRSGLGSVPGCRLPRTTTTPPTTARPKRPAGPYDKWGYAVQLALSIKNIPTGPGDTINVQGVYTNGATRYNIQDLAGCCRWCDHLR